MAEVFNDKKGLQTKMFSLINKNLNWQIVLWI